MEDGHHQNSFSNFRHRSNLRVGGDPDAQMNPLSYRVGASALLTETRQYLEPLLLEKKRESTKVGQASKMVSILNGIQFRF
jgi:hypothetical protein